MESYFRSADYAYLNTSNVKVKVIFFKSSLISNSYLNTSNVKVKEFCKIKLIPL